MTSSNIEEIAKFLEQVRKELADAQNAYIDAISTKDREDLIEAYYGIQRVEFLIPPDYSGLLFRGSKRALKLAENYERDRKEFHEDAYRNGNSDFPTLRHAERQGKRDANEKHLIAIDARALFDECLSIKQRIKSIQIGINIAFDNH